MEYKNIYRGIVIQNNDPTSSGRVKVYVPGLNLNQSKDWNQKKEEDKIFKVMGGNTNSSLSPQILENQKQKLLWAEPMLPVVGMGSPGYYNAPTDTYYIGNDSDYLSQEGNKTPQAFEKDTQQSSQRPPVSPNPSYGKPPRTNTTLDFPTDGPPFCLPEPICPEEAGGGGGGSPNPLKKTNTPLDEIINELPVEFLPQILQLDEIPDPEKNLSISEIDISVFNPTILLNDVPISKDNPIFNNECFSVPNVDNLLTFSTPILFEDTTNEPSQSYNELPIGIIVNGKKSLPNNFKLDSYNSDEVVFKDDSLKIKVPKKNIDSINIKHNDKPFDLKKIDALKPFVSSSIPTNPEKPIMPRTPVTNGSPMISRGGGGGEIFNNISSKLLPTFQRKDMHIAGANNESRATVNKCRKPSNDINKTKGANLIGNVSQMHRGPMRSPNYNNNFKGSISIPGVGSHVWVYFENGDLNYPIILGTFASQADYKGIFEKS
jgi:hypothetical protein